MAPAYPGFGNPCNGCGQCCIERPCDLARDLAGVFEAPCPCLIDQGDRKSCGLVVEPHKHIPALSGKPWAADFVGGMISQALGIGRGCDAEIA